MRFKNGPKVRVVCTLCGKSFFKPQSYGFLGENFCSKEHRIKYQKAKSKNVVKRWAEIRKKVFLRDGGKCTVCGRSDTSLHIHHINGKGNDGLFFPEFADNNIKNLVVLCQYCHSKEHGHNVVSERIEEVVDLRKKGHTLNEIGNVFGVSRERIRQILKRYASKKSFTLTRSHFS